nr:leucine-rich repeat-containing protein [Tanacetum cinerariifolium]
MKALKESKKLNRSQPHARGSSEGTGTKTLVLDGSTVILTLSSEETGTKSGVPDEIYSDDDEEKKDDADDDISIDLENTDNEETDDEVVHSNEYVNDDVDEEMYDAEDVDIGKVFLMAQQVFSTDQLVSTKYLTAGRCNNYVVLQMKTPDNPFIALVTIRTIKSFMHTVSYQGIVDKTKINILQIFHAVVNRVHVDYVALLWQENDYHSIKDDIPLVSVYSTGDVIIRWMLIPDAFSTDKICATDDYAECETVFVKKKKRKKVTGETSSPRKSLKITIKQKKAKSTPILPPSDEKERDEIIEATLLSLALHKTGIEPGSHKKNPEVVDDYDDANKTEKEDKKDEKKDDDDEKKTNDDVQKKDDAEEKDNNDHTDHTLVGSQVTSSLENRNEKMQTPIPTPPKYPRINLSSDKTISEELTTTVSPKTATTSKTKQKKEVLDHCNNVGTELAVVKMNKIIKIEMPRLLGIKSYQIEVNLTAPTLTFPGIKAHDPYTIVDEPDAGLIYLNNKEEKRVMYLVKIVKFCDATLERVWKEVKLKIFQNEFWKKPPLLGELDLDIMKSYEREITKRPRHREQMRRCESFVNGRPFLPMMKRLIAPSIRKEIECLKHSQRNWTLYPCGNNVFEVRKRDDSYGVNIENRTCTCKWWDLSGVLCVHSVAAFSFLKNDPILGVSAWYSQKMWKNAYSYFIKPVSGSSMWPQPPEEPPLPPVLKKTTDGGEADPSSAGPSVTDPSFAGPSIADPSFAGPSVADPSSTSPSVADPSSAGPSVADSTDPTDDILTQQSKTSDTVKIIEDAIATGRLKTDLKEGASLKEFQKEQKHSSLAKMVHDLVLRRHGMWMMFLLKNDVLLFESVYAF